MVSDDIELAVQLLNTDDIVAIPTETVYGLAGSIFSEKAVNKIFEVKCRPKNDPLIAHIYDIDQLKQLTDSVPDDDTYKLMSCFWPGPLTILFNKSSNVSDDITAYSKYIAVRMPKHPMTLELLKRINVPLVAPSANLFQHVSPTTPQHVFEQIGDKIPLILDGGKCYVGIESTIIHPFDDHIEILRWGGVTKQDIENVVKKPVIYPNNISNIPGSCGRHYAPDKPLIIGNINCSLRHYDRDNVGILSFGKNYNVKYQIVIDGTLDDIAHNIYSSIRTLDTYPISFILTDYVRNYGIGCAINDKLFRASVQ